MVRNEITSIFSFTPTYYLVKYENLVVKIAARYIKTINTIHLLVELFRENIFLTFSELGIFMYWTRNSMNNLLSYYGLVDARISASEKDLPVLR